MPPEPLDYQPVPEHERRNRFALRVSIGFILSYCVAVAGLAFAKVVLQPRMLQWNEVFEGPAITLSCCFVLFAAAVWVRARRRRP